MTARQVTERDLRLPEFVDARLEDLEFRPDGVIARKDRWEAGMRRVADALNFSSREGFEIPDVVAAVEKIVEDTLRLRRLLCVARAGSLAYLDDGEAQDSREHPAIDYLRDKLDDIEQKHLQHQLTRVAVAATPANVDVVFPPRLPSGWSFRWDHGQLILDTPNNTFLVRAKSGLSARNDALHDLGVALVGLCPEAA